MCREEEGETSARGPSLFSAGNLEQLLKFSIYKCRSQGVAFEELGEEKRRKRAPHLSNVDNNRP